jgi:tetratricopeptide (TPR) repeat protein
VRDAEAAATGLPWIKLGDAYASYGQYENAIAAFEKGLGKGGLKYPEEAKLHLGLAHLKAGQAAQARAVLGSVGGADGARDLARLWLIKSGAAG